MLYLEISKNYAEMMRVSKYRLVAATLAVAFSLFNVGIPVVIAACPMMGRGVSARPACCAQRHTAAGAAFGLALGKDCCRTVLVAERNRAEFVGEKHKIAVYAGSYRIDVCPVALMKFAPPLTIPKVLPAPSPPSEDIPIFTASLLI